MSRLGGHEGASQHDCAGSQPGRDKLMPAYGGQYRGLGRQIRVGRRWGRVGLWVDQPREVVEPGF